MPRGDDESTPSETTAAADADNRQGDQEFVNAALAADSPEALLGEDGYFARISEPLRSFTRSSIVIRGINNPEMPIGFVREVLEDTEDFTTYLIDAEKVLRVLLKKGDLDRNDVRELADGIHARIGKELVAGAKIPGLTPLLERLPKSVREQPPA